MKLQNYYISDADCNPVKQDESTELFLVGKVYGKSGTPDGSLIRTSIITSLNKNEAVTKSGSVYELEDMSSDYIEFIDAINRGVEVLNEWDLSLEDVMIDVPNFDDPDGIKKATDPNNLHTVYMFKGRSLDNDIVKGEVVGQSGNLVTLRVGRFSGRKHNPIMEEKEYFVNWRSLSMEAQFNIGVTGGVADLKYKQRFNDAFHLKCRPVMF